MNHITTLATIGLLSCTSGIALAAGRSAPFAPHITMPPTMMVQHMSPPATAPAPHASAPASGMTTAAKPTSTGPTFTGQPNQSCGSATAPNTPGMSAAAPGSAFNPDGKSGTVYAGQQPQNSFNTASVSQYDVACFRQP
ncbi:MAG TPA: hypothetical protein VFM34_02955 [Moraxellaceae bacterium]|nr:hypothetical protein [Moraxellaceae bacterium]